MGSDSAKGSHKRFRKTKETLVGTCAITSDAAKSIPAAITIKRDENERVLVQRAQRGEEDAFVMLYELHKRRVYSVCLMMAKDMAEAEDFTQEVFLQVFR